MKSGESGIMISASKFRHCRVLTLLAVILAGLSPAICASPLFESDEVLELSITGPLSLLLAEKERETARPFALRANDIEQLVNVRTRGKSRKRVCDFPPLRLEFYADINEQTVFKGQGELKLVTHCDDRESSEKNLLEEYLAYKIFNRISAISPFRISD